MTDMYSYFLAFVVSTMISLQLTRTVREWAKRRNWVDRPDQHRKRHVVPTPRIGGLAIYFSVVATMTTWLMFSPVAVGRAAEVLALGGLMMLVGWWDDLHQLPAWKKFLLQVGVALIAWLVGFRILGGWSYEGAGLSLGILSLPVTLLWIVGVTNAFNLIDGIDGLAAGAALFSMMSLLAAAFVGGSDASVILLLAALAGATTGFLRYNFNPASIFLGDSGSLLLGFLIALLSIQSSQKSTTAFAVAVPLVSVGLPVLDTLVVVVRRFLTRQPLFEGDRRHIHHVLVDRGLSTRQAVIMLYGFCGVLGLISLTFLNPSGRAIGLALGMLSISLGVGLQQLQIPELRQLNANVTSSFHHQRDLIAAQVAMARMVDALRVSETPLEVLGSLMAGLRETRFLGVDVALPLEILSPRLDFEHPEWLKPTIERASNGVSSQMVLRWRRSAGAVGAKPSHEFRLEHSLLLVPAGTEMDVALLRLFASTADRYPIAAVSWLTQDAFAEIEQAFVRMLRRPVRQVYSAAHPVSVGLNRSASASP
jgi:UDP-GlcNAc:undecaprenyl-phosphate/decaprenyl-phosphate GlcNAc-1-phosphate transferase